MLTFFKYFWEGGRGGAMWHRKWQWNWHEIGITKFDSTAARGGHYVVQSMQLRNFFFQLLSSDDLQILTTKWFPKNEVSLTVQYIRIEHNHLCPWHIATELQRQTTVTQTYPRNVFGTKMHITRLCERKLSTSLVWQCSTDPRHDTIIVYNKLAIKEHVLQVTAVWEL
jgi:hypothetical protein